MIKNYCEKYSVMVELLLLSVLIGLLGSWITLNNLQQPLLEAHGFRQTQTALTAYYFLHEGWQFNYQTPVAGYLPGQYHLSSPFINFL